MLASAVLVLPFTLNGAPLCERLDFSEQSLINLGEDQEFSQSSFGNTLAWLSWRALAPKGTRLPSGWTQDDPDFLGSVPIPTPRNEFPAMALDHTTQLDTTLHLDETTKDDFIDYSINFHDTLVSSQVLPDADHTVCTASFMTASFSTSIDGNSFPSDVLDQAIMLRLPEKTTFASIASLPTARTLRGIYPQTPTPNLVCVLMSDPERREVMVRKTGRKTTLCELLVADDTQSGFKITFWLQPLRESNNEKVDAQNSLNRTLNRLRVGDILLLRHIALTSFREVVYGQSLNPGIARARTTIDVLSSGNGATSYELGALPVTLVDAFIRVKKWAKLHIAGDDTSSRKRKATSTAERDRERWEASRLVADDSLPPDTMEAV